MSSNASAKLERIRKEYELALDNVSTTQKIASDLQKEMVSLSANNNTKPSRIASEVKKAHQKLNERNSELLKIQRKFEEIQKDFTKAQEALNQAQAAYSNITREQQEEEQKNASQQEKDRRILEAKIHKAEANRKQWAAKAENARRDMELWQRRIIEETEKQFKQTQQSNSAANSNSAPRSHRYVA